jgi:hypothetical protein
MAHGAASGSKSARGGYGYVRELRWMHALALSRVCAYVMPSTLSPLVPFEADNLHTSWLRFRYIEDHICSQSFPSFHRAAILALIIGKTPELVAGILRLWSRQVGEGGRYGGVQCGAAPAGIVTWSPPSWLRPSSESQQDRNTHGARRCVPLDHVRTSFALDKFCSTPSP